MGWTVWQVSLKDLIAERIQSWENNGTKCEILAHAMRGRALWKVARYSYQDGRPSEMVILLDQINVWPKTGEAGYKDISEDMGPYQLNCPLKFLDLAMPAPTGQYSVEWRKKVREYHSRTKQKLTVGQVVKLQNARVPEVTIVSVKPLLGEYNGMRYRIPRRLLAA